MNIFKSFFLLTLTFLILSACAPVADKADVATLAVPVPGANVDEMIVVDASEADVTFVLIGVDYSFFMDGTKAPELRVKKGDTVRIEFTSTNGLHDWMVDEFDAATEQVPTDETTYVTFVADQTGTFEYYCSVGQHRANGMLGKLIVE